MKTRINILISAVMLLTVMLLSSCREGPVGPAGRDGYSNVSILTFDIFKDGWGRNLNETNSWFYDLSTSRIDYNILDAGAVFFYYGLIESSGYVDKWYSVPFTDVYLKDGRYYENIMDATYSLNLISITVRDTDPVYIDWPFTEKIRIKAVILEVAQANILKQNNIDTKNYNEVKKALNIID